jgi:hypothetical protein
MKQSKRDKITNLMAKIKGVAFDRSIPIHLWVTNPREARKRLKQAEKLL